ncbi:MAG TPA: tetratricopeptide repeat protein [Terriglobales bacterium]|jgi:tetratricopeptide (TPR) repeat protein|nr:tetratricopeptide repeat protein [Terriglobales bacterium]
MKQCSVVLILLVFVAGLCISPVFAQATGTVKGVCKDMEGKPIVGATVEWFNTENGRKYALKTNKKGEYFSLGIDPGKYRVTLTQDGKELDKVGNFPVGVDEATLDFDLKASQVQAAQQQGINPEKLKEMQAQKEKAEKEAGTVKTLNEKLGAARQDISSGNFDQAVALMTEATTLDATRDPLWATLGDAYRGQARQLDKTDHAAAKKSYEQSIQAYEKAIQMRQDSAAAQKDPDANKKLAPYYNNVAEAYSKIGRVDDAVKAYTQAAQLDPANSGTYYYNMGAVLTNAGRTDEALAAFDKTIAADPNKADAYYQKGVALIAKATTDPKTGKVTPAPGTQEALNKYLELQPNGPYAEGAKGMLQYIGSTVETSFGSKKKGAKN